MSTQEADLTRQQTTAHAADTAMLTVGMLVFWPALLAMPMTTDHRHEISRMRGEKEALERSRVEQCSGTVMAQAVPTSASYAAAVAGATTSGIAAVASTTPAAAAQPRAQAWPVACPAAGTTVAYSNNVVYTGGGRDSADPRLCRGTLGSQPVRMIYGFADVNAAGADEYRLGIGALYEPVSIVPVGRATEFMTFRTISGITQQFRERWTVSAEETIQTAAGQFRTVVIDQQIIGQGNSHHQSTNRYWIDTETGLIVRKTVSIQSGTSQDRSYEAIRVTQAS